jgi:Tol biopolymer transport system component
VAADSDPVWSPDGTRLAFRSLQDGPPRLYLRPARDADSSDTIVPTSAADATPTDWRDDRVIIHAPGDKGDRDLFSVSVRTGVREVIAGTGFNETDARLSPDGRWLSYVSDESGQSDIYAMPWPRGTRVRVSFAGGSRPRWSWDGRAILFLRGTQLMRADLTASGFATPRSELEVHEVRDFDVAHRRDAVLALIPATSSGTPTTTMVVDWRWLVK